MDKTYLNRLASFSSSVLLATGLVLGAASALHAANEGQAEGQGQEQQTQATQQAQKQEEKQIEVVAIEFEPGQHNLSQEARDKLKEKLDKYAQTESQQSGSATQQGMDQQAASPSGQDQGQMGTTQTAQQQEAQDKVESIRVAVWSDQEFNPDQNLADAAQELARKRAEAIEKYITEDLKVEADVTTFNMAEQAGFLARTFNTEEAELKSIFARRGAEPTSQVEIENPELVHMRDEGGPSKAVVMISLQHEQSKSQQGQ